MQRHLTALLKLMAAAMAAVASTLLIVSLPAGFGALLYAASHAASQGVAFAGFYALIAVLGCGAILRMNLTKAGRERLRSSSWQYVLSLLIGNAVLATAGLATLSAALLDDGVGSVVVLEDGSRPTRTFNWAGHVDVAWEYFLYTFADAIPLLKVPDTFDWKPAYRITGVGHGVLLLTYKVVVVLPLLQVAALTLGRWFNTDPPAETERPSAQRLSAPQPTDGHN